MTKSSKIKNSLKRLIREGKFGLIGTPFMTVREFAKEYNISYGTAQKILKDLRAENILKLDNNTYHISDGLSARTQSKVLIGVHVRNIANSFYSALSAALTTEAAKRGIDLIIMSSANDINTKRAILTKFINLGCAGVINMNSYDDDKLKDFYAIYPLPYVFFGTPPIDGLNTDFILTDNQSSGALAAKHLRSSGAQSMFYITMDRFPQSLDERYLGFSQYINKLSGCTLSILKMQSEDSETDNHYIAARLSRAAAHNKVGIFCHHDGLAAAVLNLCRKHNIDIPRQALLVGYDDLPVSRHMTPKISTFSYNYNQIAAQCLNALQKRLLKPASPPAVIRVSTALEIRESSKPTI